MTRKVLLFATILLALALAPAMVAQTYQPVNLTVYKTVALPNALLEPGAYTMRFVDQAVSAVVIRSVNGPIIGIYHVVPTYRGIREDGVAVTVLPERGADRIAAWFDPASQSGWAFVYPHSKTTKVAQADESVITGK